MKTAEEIFDDTFTPIDSDEIMKYKKDIIQAMNEYAMQFMNIQKCYNCDGTGTVFNTTCVNCNGQGKILLLPATNNT